MHESNALCTTTILQKPVLGSLTVIRLVTSKTKEDAVRITFKRTTQGMRSIRQAPWCTASITNLNKTEEDILDLYRSFQSVSHVQSELIDDCMYNMEDLVLQCMH